MQGGLIQAQQGALGDPVERTGPGSDLGQRGSGEKGGLPGTGDGADQREGSTGFYSPRISANFKSVMDSKIKMMSCFAVAMVTLFSMVPDPAVMGDGEQCDAFGFATKWAAYLLSGLTFIFKSALVLHEIVTKAREVSENLEWVFQHRRAVVKGPRDDGAALMEEGIVDAQNTPQ